MKKRLIISIYFIVVTGFLFCPSPVIADLNEQFLLDAEEVFFRSDWEEVKEICNAWLKNAPNNPIPHFLLGEAYSALRQFTQQRKELELSIKKDKNNNVILNWAKSLREKYPDHIYSYSLLGLAFYQRNLYEEAIFWYQQVCEMQPGNAIAYSDLALAYKGKGLYEEAVVNFKKAIKLRSGEYKFYLGIASAYNELDLDKESIKNYRKALNLLYANTFLKKDSKIYKTLELALTYSTDSFRTFFLLGRAYLGRGFFNDSIALYKKAIKLYPEYIDAYIDLGYAYLMQAYYSKSSYDNAILSYTKAIELSPQNAKAYYYLSFAYEYSGMIDKARKALQKAILLDSNGKLGKKAIHKLKELQNVE